MAAGPAVLGAGASEAAQTALAVGLAAEPEVVAFTAETNDRSQAVMRRIGMTYERAVDHPGLPVGHGLRRHVLYRVAPLDRRFARLPRPPQAFIRADRSGRPATSRGEDQGWEPPP